jgi:hypothetical protein
VVVVAVVVGVEVGVLAFDTDYKQKDKFFVLCHCYREAWRATPINFL